MLNALLYSLFRAVMYLLRVRANGPDDNEDRAEAMGHINRLDYNWREYNGSTR